MADLEWLKLKPREGSQQNAFEELCCQLAGAEPAPDGSRFVRKGTPDGGVECFWKLPKGVEYGWQAKFFLTPLTASQWRQLDKSVKTALRTHPKLRKYTICIPQNRADARITGKSSFLDEWDRHVRKWRSFIACGRPRVDFAYWGTSELYQRLSSDEHAGRLLFWFEKDFLDSKWCQTQVKRAVADAGDRYTPNAHVHLSIQGLFDAIGLTPEFTDKALLLVTVGRNRFAALVKAIHKSKNRELHSLLKQVIEVVVEFCSVVRAPQHINGIVTRLRELMPHLLKQIRIEQTHARRKSEKKVSRRNDKGVSEHVAFCYQRAADSAEEIDEFLMSEGARIAGIPALLILGDAGTGKSHLLCRAALDRLEKQRPTMLILGEKLRDSEPWAQIAAVAGLHNDNPDEILGALNAAGEASQTRALLLIDALNEGEGKQLWPKNLAGLLHAAASYPWVGVCLSVRSSYETVVIPSSLGVEKLCRIEHKGFEGNSHEAIKLYCENYSIDESSIPLLHPEFSNPLFLKLFCKGLSDSGQRRMPEGIEGLPRVFDFFLESRNQRLARPENLNYDPKQDLVRKALKALSNHFVEQGRGWTCREDARNVLSAVFPTTTHDPSLFERLLSEGILGEEQFFDTDTKFDFRTYAAL